jgi:ubiquinone/menaquinone biosynthesis C-methylase UbiE
MAANAGDRLAMQLQRYFDQLAPSWDDELGPERLESLAGIVRELGIRPGHHILDIGSGTGVLLPFVLAEMRGKGAVVALDLSAKMLNQAQAKNFPSIVRFAQADVVAIPSDDSSVDLAICNSAFPHFADKAKALKEIARVLKSSGRVAICHTTGREALNQLHQSIGGAVASDLLPDEPEMRGLIKQAGLKVTHFEDRPERYLVIAEKSARA